MEEKIITANTITAFHNQLKEEEKASATVEKYLRDIKAFTRFADGEEITKETVIAYKTYLTEKGYTPHSINSMLASVHSFFNFLGWIDCKVKTVKLQRQMFCSEEKELTKAEYVRLCRTARESTTSGSA